VPRKPNAGDPAQVVPEVEPVIELEATADRVRERARAELGITGEAETEVPSLRRVLREEGVSVYPLVALSVLALVNIFQAYAFDVVTPDISRSLGLSIGAIVAARALTTLAIALSPLPMAWLTQRKARRALLSILTGVGWSLLTIYTGFVTGLAVLLVVLLFDGLTTGSVVALHTPLLLDSYPAKVRVRVLSAYSALGDVGLAFVLSPLLVAVLTGVFSLTWRGVFLVLGLLSLLGTTVAFRLRDPGFGRFDTERVRQTYREVVGGAAVAMRERDVELRFFEIMRRLMLIPTVRRLALAFLVLGIFAIPLNTFISFFLDEKFGLGPTGRSLFFAVLALAGMVSLTLFARRGEAIFRRDPARILTLSGAFLSLAVVAFGFAALMPTLIGVTVLFCIGSAAQVLLYPTLNMALLSVVEARWRVHLTAVFGIFLSAGGILGALFLSGIERRFGIAGSILALAVPGMIGTGMVASARRFLNADIDRMIDAVVEEEEIARIQASGDRLPMLACRSIDFSYGQLQVLFGVDFAVDDQEMVALLGVNGAGKSTLLKVISGIGLPSRGSVRFRGHDVTYLDAERRLKLGITQVPGGRAVFAPLSVVDNLRVYGYALGRNRPAVDQAIERSFATFPKLAARRNQQALTLSGGEQQMLGLCKALILRPRLLLIDELSLGLAPMIVAQLLDMVREINADGTAVVLVEQSVNIALSVARHAYFMERGEIRFDGPSDELLGRDDLLRAVFLEGAGERTSE
jgi:ABC-type branched-subunit amino acid transport system ATPase component/sugar phosphate permease